MRNSEIARIKRKDIKHIKDTGIYILKAYNHKTEYYNTENEEYRKIPLHPFVVSFLKFYIKEKEETNKITIYPDSYLFGRPKTNKDGEIIDGILHPKTFDRAIKDLYRHILMKQRYKETGKLDEVVKIDEDELIEAMKKHHITYYSLRHTFHTLCVLFRGLKGDETDDLINYFTGHKIDDAIRANYTHINKIDDRIFYNDYGKFVIGMLNKYIFLSEEERQAKKESIKNRFEKVKSENPHLLNDNGEINKDMFIEKFFNKGVETENVGDDIFESI